MAKRRLTVRLDGLLLERLRNKCSESGFDASHITRKALESYLAVETNKQNPNTAASLVLPQEMVLHTREFMGFSGAQEPPRLTF
jgi:hypothetical protein